MKSILKNEGLFLTATKQKHELIHPKSLDSNIEQYMKERQAISIIGSTGIDVVSKLEGNPHNPPKETLRFDHSRSKPTHKSLKEARSNSDLDFRPERLTQHKHEKMKEKITVQSSRGQYDNYPIKPGFEFFDCLIKAPRAKITSLIQNVPESLYFSDRLYYLHTQPNLKVGVSTEIHGYRFVKIVECSRISKGDIFDNIGAIMRRRDEKIQDMQKVILDWHSFGSKISNNETFPGSLTQRYIKSPGIRPAVTRIHYSCQTKSNKANFAYFIKSLGLDEIEETNIQKCVVDMDKPETLEVFKISGPALKSFEREAENLVVFLNKAYNIRIQEIILDYLRDAAGRIWLCGCKYIKIDQTTLQNAFQPLAE